MLKAAVTALALFGLHPSTIQKTTVAADGWTLEIRNDTFVGKSTCRAWRGGAVFDGAAVVFALGSSVNTRDADYRLDLGAAHSIHDVALRVRVLGAPITLEPIDNPSRGLVVLPAADLVDANDVWIRANQRSAPRRFVVSGLRNIVERERAAACLQGA